MVRGPNSSLLLRTSGGELRAKHMARSPQLAAHSLVVGSLDNRAGPPNHVVQRSSGRDHRIDGIFLFNLEIDQHRPLVLARRLDGGHDAGTLRNCRAPDAVSPGQLYEIRIE